MTVESIKVVFDTNILVAGHFWKGPPYRMLAVEAGLATLILSDPILSEFGEKLTGKFGVPKSEDDSIVQRWATRAARATINGKSGCVPGDADDDKFFEIAIVGGAAVIVSGTIARSSRSTETVASAASIFQRAADTRRERGEQGSASAGAHDGAAALHRLSIRSARRRACLRSAHQPQ